jgi:hypothetical protein
MMKNAKTSIFKLKSDNISNMLRPECKADRVDIKVKSNGSTIIRMYYTFDSAEEAAANVTDECVAEQIKNLSSDNSFNSILDIANSLMSHFH